MVQPHVVLVTFPAQGHVNPSLQFAKWLIQMGIEVTFVTTVFGHRCTGKADAFSGNSPKGLNIASFSDGYDDGFNPKVHDTKHYMSEMRSRGSQALKDIIVSASAGEAGRPVTSVVYTILIPWVAEMARDVRLPCALLWIQPAAVLDIYYYYFHRYEDACKDADSDPNRSVQMPGLPPLSSRDLPSFLLPSGSRGSYGLAIPAFKEEIENLDLQTNPTVLVNTFDALEADGLKAIESYNLVGIGPLVPSDRKPTDEDHIMDWLSSKPKSSVVYISFGTLLNLSKTQKEEMAKGLVEMKRPFLWAIRDKSEEEEEKKLSCMAELEKQAGMIVPWCCQPEVLKHPSVGCFVTHCGWNSTLESICSGVPLVAFPFWTDQVTNAKLIQDLWKMGVRVAPNQNGVVESEEIKRCIETVMNGGDEGEGLRRNAKKWRDLAREAIHEGGSSDRNLRAFLGNVGKD